MYFLPINIRIENKTCLLVGGGSVAFRKARQVIAFGGKVRVVAPVLHPDIEKLIEQGDVLKVAESFNESLLDNCHLVIAATNDYEVNQQVAQAAEKRTLWVNVVDNPSLCTFIMPAMVKREPLVIGIGSSGVAPVFARKLREFLEWIIPETLGDELNKTIEIRSQVKQRFKSMAERRRFWESYFEKLTNNTLSIHKNTVSPLSLHPVKYLDQIFNDDAVRKGSCLKVSCDNYDSLTLKGLNALQKADKVLVVGKVLNEVRNCIRRDAEVFDLNSNQQLVLQKAKVKQWVDSGENICLLFKGASEAKAINIDSFNLIKLPSDSAI